MSSDWGGDYSYLVHSIEGKLSKELNDSISNDMNSNAIFQHSMKSLTNKPDTIIGQRGIGISDVSIDKKDDQTDQLITQQSIHSNYDNNIASRNTKNNMISNSDSIPNRLSNVSNKRPRQSSDTYEKLLSTMASPDDSKLVKYHLTTKLNNDKTSPNSLTKGQVLHLQQELDDMKLSYEQLQEKYKILQDQLQFTQNKSMKQLIFMENEILRFQKIIEEKNDKYYEEKKKWQSHTRTLEGKVEKLSNNQIKIEDSIRKSSNSNKKDIEKEYENKIKTIEMEYNEKIKKYQNSIKEFEEKVVMLTEESNKVRELQQDKTVLMKIQSDYEQTISEMRLKSLSSEKTISSLETEINTLKLQLQSNNNKIKLVQHQSKLYEGEISSLRSLLSSYEDEFKLGRPTTVKMNKLQEEVIQKLRLDIDQIRHDADIVTRKAIEIQLSIAKDSNESKAKDMMASESESIDKKRINELENEVSTWKERYEGLQAYTKTDLLPGFIKVIHMTENPYDEAMKMRSSSVTPTPTPSSIPIDELHRLRREVKVAAKDKPSLENHDTMTTSNDNILSTSSDQPNPMNVTSTVGITTVGADTNKLNQRLKEMFKDRITSFREAVYLLTGYKVDLYNAPSDNHGSEEVKRLRLRSMYAESAEDSLIFQWHGETLELLETPFASKVNPTLFTFLHSRNSVPAFLSSLTLDLYENQTFMG